MKPVHYLFLISLIAPQHLHAANDHNLSATIYIGSDYLFRGISQTDNEAAIQAGLDYAHSSGFSAGLFTSNVNFKTRTRREQDAYIGYTKEFTNGIGLDLAAWYYGYHNESTLNYPEYTIGVHYKWLTAKYWYTNDYSGTGGEQSYYETGLSIPISDNLNFALHLGHTDFDRRAGINDYTDYSASLSTSYKGFNLQLMASGTNENQFGSLEDERIVLTVSRSFQLIP